MAGRGRVSAGQPDVQRHDTGLQTEPDECQDEDDRSHPGCQAIRIQRGQGERGDGDVTGDDEPDALGGVGRVGAQVHAERRAGPASGLGDVLRHYKTSFIDLNHDEPCKRLNLGRLTGLEHLYLSQTVATADVLISLPKLKTHHGAVATLSLKNLFGTMPGICYGWPKNELHWRGIDNSIVDIALTRTPDLAIVDGIVGMEGDGPLNGTPVNTGVIVMGTDLVAVDATCCRLMELDPARVAYLVMGNMKKLGQLAEPQIKQLGDTVAERSKPYETVEHFQGFRLAKPA